MVDRMPRICHVTFLAAFAFCAILTQDGIVSADDAPDNAGAQHFDRTIAPLLARRCLDCHNPTDQKGGLDLTSASTAKAGGDSGAVVEPGLPEESLLWSR